MPDGIDDVQAGGTILPPLTQTDMRDMLDVMGAVQAPAPQPNIADELARVRADLIRMTELRDAEAASLRREQALRRAGARTAAQATALAARTPVTEPSSTSRKWNQMRHGVA
jgi:hypothetical protein